MFRVQLGRPYTEHPTAPARPTFIAKLAQRCFDVDHAACLDLGGGRSLRRLEFTSGLPGVMAGIITATLALEGVHLPQAFSPRESRPEGLAICCNQVGFLPFGLSARAGGSPRVSRRRAIEPAPRSRKLSSVASDASRISPTVFKPAALSALLILVENRMLSIGVSSGSPGAG